MEPHVTCIQQVGTLPRIEGDRWQQQQQQRLPKACVCHQFFALNGLDRQQLPAASSKTAVLLHVYVNCAPFRLPTSSTAPPCRKASSSQRATTPRLDRCSRGRLRTVKAKATTNSISSVGVKSRDSRRRRPLTVDGGTFQYLPYPSTTAVEAGAQLKASKLCLLARISQIQLQVSFNGWVAHLVVVFDFKFKILMVILDYYSQNNTSPNTG